MTCLLVEEGLMVMDFLSVYHSVLVSTTCIVASSFRTVFVVFEQ